MWFVCYCRSKATLPLVAALHALGVKAECPSFSFRRRKPRRPAIEVITKPLIDGFFFVHVDDWQRAASMGWLAGVDMSALQRLRSFASSVDFYAQITDDELHCLIEQGEAKSHKRARLHVGDDVSVSLGPLAGFRFSIVALEGNQATLDSPLFPAIIKVATFLLRKNKA